MLFLTGATRRPAVVLGLLSLLALLASAPAIFAADVSWNGSHDTVWGTKQNWSTNNVPTSTDNALFNTAFANQPSLGSTAATVGGLWMATGVGQNVTIGGTATLTLASNTINGTAGLGILVNNSSAYTLTINGPVALGATQTWTNSSSNVLTIGAVNLSTFALTVNGTGSTTISGIVSGTGSLSKGGTGTLILSGTNTYTGTTSIIAGVLNIQNGFGLGTTAAGTTVSGGAALQLQNSISVGAEALTLNGSGIANDGALRNISGTNSWSGNLTLGSASTIGSDAGSLTLSGTINNGGFLLTTTGAGAIAASGIISGSGGLAKNGTGALTLSGVNTYTGGTNLNAGTLNIDNASALGTGTFTIAGGSNGIIDNTTGSAITLSTNNTQVWNGNFTFTGTQSLNLGTGAVTLGASRIVTVNGSSLTVGGAISGSGFSLTKAGVGTLTLSGTNTYSGGMILNAGTLNIDNASALGTGTFTIAGGSNGIIDNTTGSAITLSTNNGQIWNGNFTFTGTQSLNLGTGAVTLGASRIVTVNGSTLTVGGAISGSGFSLTKAGAGTLTLSGVNTYSGGTILSAGTLQLSGSGTLGATSGALTVNGGTLDLNGTSQSVANFTGSGGAIANNATGTNVTLTIGSNNGTGGNYAGVIADHISGTGTVALTKTGTGTITLSGSNTFSGGTTINGGTLVVSSDANLGAFIGGLTLNAGTLEVSTGFATTRNITLGNTASTFQIDPSQTYTDNGILSGTGALNKSGSGTMLLGGINTFSGGTNVSAGTLQLSVVNQLLNTGAVTISGGTFDLQTFNQVVGAVTLSSATISSSTGVLTGSSFDLQSGTVSAILGGIGTVTKSTPGTVTLSGVNTYTSATTVSAGTLQINTNGALGTILNGTTVSSGAALKLNAVNYSLAEALTLNGSGISGAGALTNSGTSTFAGAINIATNATISAGGGTLDLTGGISKNGTTLTFAGGGTVNIMNNGITGTSPNSDLVVDGTTVVLDTANSYNGPTTIQNSGTLKLGASNVMPTSPQTDLTVNTSSIFDLASFSDGVASLTGDSTAIVKNSVASTTSILTVNPSSGSTTFAGVIVGTNSGAQGDIALVKSGAGTLVLTGLNTFSGSTTINAGTLTAADTSGSALASTSSITINSGGTLLLGAINQINNSATMTLAGGTFSKGSYSEGAAGTVGIGALTLTASGSHLDFGTGMVGVLCFASFTPNSNTLIIDNWIGTAGTVGSASTDRLIFASDQSSNLSDFSFTNFSGAQEIALGSGFYEIVPVTATPEPSTYLAGVIALIALGCNERRLLLRFLFNKNAGKT